MFANLSRDLQKQRYDLGTYIGIIVDNNDPLKLQRVKVRIHQLHRGIPDAELPWAVKQPQSAQGFGSGLGSFGVPAKFTKVAIKFMNDSLMYPKYVGGLINSKDQALTEFASDYPEVYGQIDCAGNLLKVVTKQGGETVQFIHKSGSRITIAADGSIEITSAKDLTLNANGSIALRSSTAAYLETQGTLYFNCAYVQSNSASPTVPSSVTPRTRPVIPEQTENLDY